MDIYILRDGQETGPFSEETTRTLLAQGGVAANDYAWRSGMPKWVVLSDLLAAGPMAISPAETPTHSSAAKAKPATPKQKALLSYLGTALPADLSKDQAALLVNDAMEDPNNANRLTQWNEERLRLYPDLFAAEIQAKKENRAQHFFELCQTVGAEYFSGITKAHCQVLVGFLDVKFPHWDAREAEAALHYFFPAVAEKFPQLVHRSWRGRLHYVEGQKVAPEIVRKSATSQLRQSATSPLVAVTRGVVLGALILGVLYLGYRTVPSGVTAAPPAKKSPEPAAQQPATEPPPASAPPATTAAVAPQDLPPIEPLAQVETTPPPAAPNQAPVPVDSPDPNINPAPGAVVPAPPMAPADPNMIPAAPTTALDTAPVATLPGTEPPVPVPPPPATMPTPGVLPSSNPEPESVPAPPPISVTPEPAPAPATTKTNLLLTKPVEVQLAYGKIILPAGTAVKLVSRQGAALKVSYSNSVITVPLTSTDLQ